VIRLTAGNVSDVRAVDALLDRAGTLRRVIADKGYDANSLRRRLKATGATPVIPGRTNRTV
jgi:IS5 family transposase